MVSEKISFKRNIKLYIYLFFFILVLGNIAFYFGFKPNITEKTYQKNFGMGNGYLNIELSARNKDEEGISYSYNLELYSDGNVDAIKLVNITISFYWNQYVIDTLQETYYDNTKKVGGEGYVVGRTLDIGDNITIEGTVASTFSAGGTHINEIFDLNVKYEFLVFNWFEQYGVITIIVVQFSFVVLFGSIIYIIYKRKKMREIY